VLSAGSGEDALAALAAGGAVNLLVSDLSMPGMDGLALIREAQRRQPGLPAILLTGFATDAEEQAMGGTIRARTRRTAPSQPRPAAVPPAQAHRCAPGPAA